MGTLSDIADEITERANDAREALGGAVDVALGAMAGASAGAGGFGGAAAAGEGVGRGTVAAVDAADDFVEENAGFLEGASEISSDIAETATATATAIKWLTIGFVVLLAIVALVIVFGTIWWMIAQGWVVTKTAAAAGITPLGLLGFD